MRTRLSIFPLMAVLAGVVSCQKAPVADPQPETPALKTFYATIGEDASKVFADDELRVLWDADDRVSIFDHYTLNEEYRFTGETGDNAGWFEQIPYGSFVTGNDLDLVYAVYPYRKSTAIDNDGVLSVEYPAEQVFRKGSFGLGANTMVSVTEDNRLQFRNGCGYLVLKLYGHLFGVSSITLRGNAGEPLAGKALVAMEPKGVPSVKMTEDAQSEVTLMCKDPVVLGDTPEEAVAFWFALPPTTFDEGFTIEVKGSKGEVVKRSTSKPVKVSRNLRVSMAPMSVEDTAPWGFVTIDQRKACSLATVTGADSEGFEKFDFKEGDEVRVHMESWRCRDQAPGHIGYHVTVLDLDIPGHLSMHIPLERDYGDYYISSNKSVAQAHLNCYRISEENNYLEFDMTVTLYRETGGDIRVFYAGPIYQ